MSRRRGSSRRIAATRAKNVAGRGEMNSRASAAAVPISLSFATNFNPSSCHSRVLSFYFIPLQPLPPGFPSIWLHFTWNSHVSRVHSVKKRKGCRRVYPRGVGRKRAKKAAVTAFYLHTASPFSSASSLSTPALFAFRNWPATTAATSFLPSFLPHSLPRAIETTL